ncbi:MAG: ATP-binding cassette domain-containing protein [Actinobacteria bacterium]|nr:ATP-binding cassette domain-containing protein [Actinomycetota bacterium]
MSKTVVSIQGLSIVREGRTILSIQDLRIEQNARIVVLGANGSGKSTLLSVLSARLWPSSGNISMLGSHFGSVDLRLLRSRIGLVAAGLARSLDARMTAREVIFTGSDGALAPWWSEYSGATIAAADQLVAGMEKSLGHELGSRPFVQLSEGERQQVLLARMEMQAPELVLLDEPFAGLDLGARERLMLQLEESRWLQGGAPAVLVTHHVEEIPRGTTQLLILAEGRVLASGDPRSVLNSENLRDAFGIDVSIAHLNGRFALQSP